MRIQATQDRKTKRIKVVVLEAIIFQDEKFLSRLFDGLRNNRKLTIVDEDGLEDWICGDDN